MTENKEYSLTNNDGKNSSFVTLFIVYIMNRNTHKKTHIVNSIT